MGLPGWSKIREHQQINKRIDAWLGEHPEVGVHVPVDSPAANFPICKIAKKHRARVMHLVAPQVWAWGSWRVNKLRKLSDLVLCLLPFEQSWFEGKRVPARFIGHPLFDEALDVSALDRRAAELPQGAPRLALLPGSRPAELSKNFPILLESFRRLKARLPRRGGRGRCDDARGCRAPSCGRDAAGRLAGGTRDRVGGDRRGGPRGAISRWWSAAR
jgi:lipid-A-disaccharide synthase